MTTMKNITRPAALILACAAWAMPAVAQSDRDLFYSNGYATASTQSFVVQAGSATIDDALQRIIPMPYQIVLDQTVPESLYLVWRATNNWMDALQTALAPIGLEVVANWQRNEIIISWTAKQYDATPVQGPTAFAQAHQPQAQTPEVLVKATPLIGRDLNSQENQPKSQPQTAPVVVAQAQPTPKEPEPVARRGKFSVSKPVQKNSINSADFYGYNNVSFQW